MALIAPAPGLNPDVNQIYPIVNTVFEQMTGREDIQAVDTASLVAMGKTIEDSGKKDLWLNTLNKRIGHTITDYRVYRNKFSELNRTQMEWGAIVQKLTSEMPEARYDDMPDVGKLDGQSLDHYIISNPKVHQRLFDKETPYSFMLTIQDKYLKEAFLNSGAMGAFINQIFGKVRNKMEFTNEELGRLCIANFGLNLKSAQHYHLVSMYNSTNPAVTVTTQTARYDGDFLRYAVGIMNAVSNKMESMSVLYNSDGFDRFTPRGDQKFYLLADFMTILETQVSYAAFNPQYVTARANNLIPYWQASSAMNDPNNWDTITSIKGTVTNDKGVSVEKELNNLIGILFDYDALGTFREEERVYTTPINARGGYYNTFWHEDQLWFNDMSENGVAFFLD